MLRTAVIGVGYLGRFHAQKHRDLNGKKLQFVGVCDANPQRAEEIAKETGSSPFSKYQDLLGKVDAVTIAANTTFHFEIASFFLKNNIHVLLEKPIAETLQQAEDLCGLAQRGNLRFQIGHVERFNPAFLAVRPHVRQPHFFRAERLAPFKARAADVDVVLDVMIHDIDLAISMIGSRVKAVSAVGGSVITKSTDFADSQLIFETGTTAHLTASRVWPDTVRRIEVHDSHQIWDLDLGGSKARKLSASNSANELQVENIEVSPHDAMMVETLAFVESIEKGQRPVVDGQDGLYALEIAHWVRDEIQRNRF